MYTKFYRLLFGLLFSVSIFTAKETALFGQSLENKEDREKSIKLVEEAEDYITGNLENVRIIGGRALELAERSEYPAGIARSCNLLARYYYTKNIREECLRYARRSLEITSRSGDSLTTALNLLIIGKCLLNDNYKGALDTLFIVKNIYKNKLRLFDQTDLYSRIALGYLNLSMYDSSLVYNKIALSESESHNFKEISGRVLNTIGVTYWKWSKYDKALEYYIRSLKIKEAVGDNSGAALALANIGKVYEEWSRYNMALKYYLDAYRMANESEQANSIAYSLHNLGNLYYETVSFDSAKYYYNLSMQEYNSFDPEVGIILNVMKLGEIELIEGNYEKALEYLEKALDSAEKTDNKERRSELNLRIGQTMFKKGRIIAARRYAEESMRIAGEIGLTRHELEADKLLSQIFESDNPSKALFYYKRYSELKDSIFSNERSRQIAELNRRFDADRRARENQLLRKENEISSLRHQKEKNIRILLIIILFSAIGLVLMLIRSNSAKEKLNQKLKLINNTKDKLFSIVSHDLRNPVHSILSYADLLLLNHKNLSEKDIEESLQSIKRSASSVHGLLENLLTWARSQREMINVERIVFNLRNVSQM